MQQSLTIVPGSTKKWFWFFLVLTCLAAVLMKVIVGGLSTSTIIDFEIAKTVDRANLIMSNWAATDRELFLRSVYADFLFIIGYTGTLFFGSRYFGRLSRHMVFKKAGYFFSWLALIAGCCDVLENIAMLFTVKNHPVGWIVHFTYDMAVSKFSLIFIVVFFMIISLFFRFLSGKEYSLAER